ncbi:MAG: PIN domain-containing protein, partial [Myxococcales bacterium]|nr:PIN domain-containing protein [Myxococcales bacterium]
MQMPDVNVLVYAHRSDEVAHAFYRDWVEATLASPTPFGLSALVAGGFLRVVTNPRIYQSPTPIETALAAIDAIARHPNCVHVGPDPDHLSRLSTLCRAVSAAGKLVADAQHAAIAMGSAACWVTRDQDFARFEPHGLQWLHLVPPAK